MICFSAAIRSGFLVRCLKQLLPPAVCQSVQFPDSVGACQLNGKWALVSKNGKVKTDYTYDDVMVDENKFCAGQKRIFVKEQGSWRMIDKKGESVGELTFFQIVKGVQFEFVCVFHCKHGYHPVQITLVCF